jgi:ketosteroid isomerase-like protein
MKGTAESEKSLSQFNKEVVRRYNKAWEQADLMTLGELIAEDFVNHSPPLPPNRQEMLEFAVEHRSQFPTGRYTLQTLVAEDDLVLPSDIIRVPTTGKRLWAFRPAVRKRTSISLSSSA